MPGGIPRFVPADNYALAFGEQWKRFRTTQLDSRAGHTLSRDRVRRVLGPVADDLDGKEVLECGCGAGRFTEVLLDLGARVTSIDLSLAVEANAENFPPSQSHRIGQADILRLPFASRQFDLVFCLGVVQHTPNPEATIVALYEQVRPGGWLALDHYTDRLRWYSRTAPLYRAVLRRATPADAQQRVRRLVDRWLPLHRKVIGRPWLRRALVRVSPVVSFHERLPGLSEDQQSEWALLDTHDALTDWYKHFRSPRAVRQALLRLGARDVRVQRNDGIVEALAHRPASAEAMGIGLPPRSTA
jgi:2-polyprenyl-3-methyl-5-hydroxy-6-metoxy-1,4-benzoquinol methylase